ncbi:MAG TPA: hypothetical protein PLN06_00660 [Bacteroidales bacterium]|nr:hypothetical protein [Bacteroidales bacterium]HOU95121.1 hypothetical protein [Bacteroidales bacterium]HQG36389.1 hypothetical protein [Bacteroidales bacterium]HQG53716.1 hypothetical protein [Bacteroidales bacterium]HQJ21101.1 hypothetical protein [Bacteroidales bacterium]
MKIKSIKAFIIIITGCLIVFFPAKGQPNLIGYHEREVRNYMKVNQKDMVLQGLTFNNTFRYLKYTDRGQTQTLFFFLSADSVCRSIRLLCDKNLKDNKIAELNSKYKPIGNNQWEDERNGQKYSVELKDEEWTLNISINVKPKI